MDTVYDVKYYETENGEKPFQKWLDGLKDTMGRAKVHIRIDRARLGNFGDVKHLDDGVFELRIDFGPGYRVYFSEQKDSIILLLLGGNKRTQTNDIKRAKQFWAEFRERCYD